MAYNYRIKKEQKYNEAEEDDKGDTYEDIREGTLVISKDRSDLPEYKQGELFQ